MSLNWLKCPNCKGYYFKLAEDEDGNIHAFCLDCENAKRTNKPQFVMMELFEVPQEVLKNEGSTE